MASDFLHLFIYFQIVWMSVVCIINQHSPTGVFFFLATALAEFLLVLNSLVKKVLKAGPPVTGKGLWFGSRLPCLHVKYPWARQWTPNCSWCTVGTLHGSHCHQCINVYVNLPFLILHLGWIARLRHKKKSLSRCVRLNIFYTLQNKGAESGAHGLKLANIRSNPPLN